MFLKWYKERGTIARKPGSGMVCYLAHAAQRIIEQAMEEDDKTTAIQLQVRLDDYGMYSLLTTTLWNRHLLGWVYRDSA